MLHLDPIAIVTAAGYLGIAAIVFAESGLFFGFFFPGDSLLFTAGLLASQEKISFAALLLIVPLCAIAGDTVGYLFGTWVGPRIFTKKDSFFFNPKHIERSQLFYEKYGAQAIIFARFVPVVRTFVPILAGVGKMRYGTFIFYNIIGGVLWGAGMLTLGYALGNTFPNVEKYFLPIVLLIIFISLIPLLREVWLHYKSSPK